METQIQRFRRHGVQHFGKEFMDRLTDDQIGDAWCFAFRCASDLTAQFGKQPDGTLKEIFFSFIKYRYMV